jgi:hypothetical protein
MAALYGVLNGSERVIIQEINIYENQLGRLSTNDTVGEIQTRCAVKIYIDSQSSQSTLYPNDSSTSNSPTTRVSILGKIESVHAAMKMIYQLIGTPAGSSPGMEIVPNAPFQSPSSGPILALGKDGTSGHLESAFTLPDGSQQQVAEINNDVMGRIVGARSATLALIRSKSGANLQVLKADNVKGTTRLVLSGSSQSVSLAAQMVQEVLVNGTAKLLKMPDAPTSIKGNPQLMLSPHVDAEGMNYFGGISSTHQGPAASFYNGASTIPMYPGVTLSSQVRY